jgi:hypothetical protein
MLTLYDKKRAHYRVESNKYVDEQAFTLSYFKNNKKKIDTESEFNTLNSVTNTKEHM